MIQTDLIIPITAFAGFVLVSLFYFVFKYQNRQSKSSTNQNNDAAQRQPIGRRAIGNRNRVRGGLGTNRAEVSNENNEPGRNNEEESTSVDIDDTKVGTKKRAKLEAKAEKKAQREAELKLREQRKKQQEKEDADRKLKEEKEKLEEEKREQEERLLEEEKKRKEEEEYQKLKSAFVIEEEGFDEDGEDGKSNLLQEFIAHIKKQKVVMLEDVAAKFNLKIQTVINRINELLESGDLTGVIDDRGKFIYITLDELQAVADFVRKRGRVTIQELVENSNNLITLN